MMRRLAWNTLPFGLASVAVLAVVLLTYYFTRLDRKFQRVYPTRGNIVEAVYGLGSVKSEQNYDLTVIFPTILQKVLVSEGEAVAMNQPLIVLATGAIISAPFEGIVSSLRYQAGEVISSREPILTVINPLKRYVLVSLEQNDALRVREGQKAYLSFEDTPAQRYLGAVQAVYPKASEFLAKVSAPSLPEQVLPGMSLNVSIVLQEKENALLIPAAAVVNNQVLILRQGHKKTVTVSVGLRDQDMLEIVGGDLVISDVVLVPRL